MLLEKPSKNVFWSFLSIIVAIWVAGDVMLSCLDDGLELSNFGFAIRGWAALSPGCDQRYLDLPVYDPAISSGIGCPVTLRELLQRFEDWRIQSMN